MGSLEKAESVESHASDPHMDMTALQEAFANYLIMARQKSKESADTKETGFMAKMKETKQAYKEMKRDLKKAKDKMKDKMDDMKTIKNLRAEELEALRQFMARVHEDKKKQPVKMARPEGLELNLLGVALFSGNEIFSKAIRRITKSSFSHVAVLLHDSTKDPTDHEGWYIYSANGSASQIMADHTLPQVQLEKWTHSVGGYDGVVATRLMIFKEGTIPTSKTVTELVDKWMGMPYERHVMIMIKAMTRTNTDSHSSANSAFCSEICYRFFTTCGVLEDNEVAENVWPKDFTDESERLKLLIASWDEIKLFKGTPPPVDGKAKFYKDG